MAYCILRFDGGKHSRFSTIKTAAELQAKIDHNSRSIHPANADPMRTCLNQQLAGYRDIDAEKIYQDVISESEYYKTHNVAKNAVIAREAIMTFSPEAKESIDVDAWMEKSMEWFRTEFPTFKIYRADLHADESTEHIHILFAPTADNGKFANSRWFGADKSKGEFDGREKMRAYQDRYALAMKQFNLQRGVKHSKATHQEVKRFYGQIKELDSIELPDVKDGMIHKEKAKDYKDRLEPVVKEREAQVLKLQQLYRQEKNKADNLEIERDQYKELYVRERDTVNQIVSLNQGPIDNDYEPVRQAKIQAFIEFVKAAVKFFRNLKKKDKQQARDDDRMEREINPSYEIHDNLR
jgi:hypothetical protein